MIELQMQRMSMKYLLFPLLLIVIVFSCTEPGSENLPPSTGRTGDIFLIMDSVQWKGPLGRTLDSIFRAEMEGLPREEAIFHMRWIDPRKLNFVLRQRRNLIFAVTFDQNTIGARKIRNTFTSASLEKIDADPNLFSQNARDVFAKNQEVLFLFAQTEQQLIDHVRANKARLVEYFNLRERERLTSTLFKGAQTKGIESIIKKEFTCELKIPFGYQLAQQESDFFWLRQINPYDDKDIFIARKKYTSQTQFQKDSLIAFRDAICKKYLFEDPERSDTHLLTETSVPYKPVLFREINFHNKFAVEMKGLWRTNNLTMGGPFISFTFVDEPLGMLYYIEGFTFSPGKDQREIMRELETILYTFRTSNEITPEKS
ncbi:MAG: DUF4837 domain-containing protein [Bacteroidota bacterium]|nr:MAG: DUF4837 domain-containing protein [Bacteroidota bacterium]